MPSITPFNRSFVSPFSGIGDIFPNRARDLILEQQAAVQRYYARSGVVRAQAELERRGIQIASTLTIDSVVSNAAIGATGEVADAISVIAQTYKAFLDQKSGTFRKMWDDVGQEAINATVIAYENKSTGNRGGVSSAKRNYRSSASDRFRRYGGGKLGKALRSKAMYQATPQGILFINRTHLDIAAKQWYRLEFGAGPRANTGKKHGNKQVKLFGKNAGKISLLGFKRSPNFLVPKGFWSPADTQPGGRVDLVKPSDSRRGQDVFVPANYYGGKEFAGFVQQYRNAGQDPPFHANRFYGRGIASQAFLDAGVNAIAKNGPIGLERIFSEIAEESISGANEATRRQFEKRGIDLSRQRNLLDQTAKTIISLDPVNLGRRSAFASNVRLLRPGYNG